MVRYLLMILVCLAASVSGGDAARAQIGPGASLLEQIQARGYLLCGVTSNAAGFSTQSATGEWRGLDVDFCRALAATLFDDASKAHFLALSAKERLVALQGGLVDVLAGGAPWTQARDAGQKVLYVATTFHDGQGFLVRKARQAAVSPDPTPAKNTSVSVCVQQGTSLELDLVDYFHANKIDYQPRLFATPDEAAKAYDAGQCDVLSAELSALYAARATLGQPSDHVILPDMISKAPHGPIVRQGDDQWFSIVRWTLFAMINAEELDVSSRNVDQALKSESAGVKRLLGVDGDHGEGLGLSSDWVYRIVKHVGNYGEIFERNLGQGSPLAMERRLDALWSKGGLMYAPPVR